jgi:hypothetical protein
VHWQDDAGLVARLFQFGFLLEWVVVCVGRVACPYLEAKKKQKCSDSAIFPGERG